MPSSPPSCSKRARRMAASGYDRSVVGLLGPSLDPPEACTPDLGAIVGAGSGREGQAVHVRSAAPEAEALVEPVGGPVRPNPALCCGADVVTDAKIMQ